MSINSKGITSGICQPESLSDPQNETLPDASVNVQSLAPESEAPAGFTPKDELEQDVASSAAQDPWQDPRISCVVDSVLAEVVAVVVGAVENSMDAGAAEANLGTAAVVAVTEEAVCSIIEDLPSEPSNIPATSVDKFDWKDLALDVPVTLKDTYVALPDNSTQTEQPHQLAQEPRHLQSENVSEEKKK